MVVEKIKKKINYLLLSLLIALADWTIKSLVTVNLKGSNGIKLLNGVIEITYLENKGAALGSFSGMHYFLISVTIVLVCGLIFTMFKNSTANKILLISLSLVLGGGIGNLVDRISLGYVVDYIKLSFFSPICNLSDYCITLGGIGLIYYIVFLSDKKLKVQGSNE